MIAPNIDSQLGMHFPAGRDILQIVNSSQKKIVLSIDQEDFDTFRSATSTSVHFFGSHTGKPFDGKLKLIEPTASISTHPQLTALAGGPLAVRPQTTATDSGAVQFANKGNGASDVELITARFKGVVSVSSQVGATLRVGINKCFAFWITAWLCRASANPRCDRVSWRTLLLLSVDAHIVFRVAHGKEEKNIRCREKLSIDPI